MSSDIQSNVVRLKLSEPIRSLPTATVPLMTVGAMLLSYPLAWILLLQYHQRDKERTTATTSGLDVLVDTLAYLVLDATPLLANGGLIVFIAAFFFYTGTLKKQQQKTS